MNVVLNIRSLSRHWHLQPCSIPPTTILEDIWWQHTQSTLEFHVTSLRTGAPIYQQLHIALVIHSGHDDRHALQISEIGGSCVRVKVNDVNMRICSRVQYNQEQYIKTRHTHSTL